MAKVRNKPGPPASDHGVYGIAVAAELSGVSQQSLRLYERFGLMTPARSEGGTRRYSADDLERIQRISELAAAGANLASIARILSLEDRNAALDDRNVTLESDNEALKDRNATLERDNVTLRGTSAGRTSPRRPSASLAADNNSAQKKPIT